MAMPTSQRQSQPRGKSGPHAKLGTAAADGRHYNCTDPKPMLWRVKKNGTTAFLSGSYHVMAEQMDTHPVVAQALGCADVGYFSLPCPATAGGGMGHYFVHCSFYPVSKGFDSIADRLHPADVESLQAAFTSLASLSAPGCEEKSMQFRSSIESVNRSSFRMALYPYYSNALQLLNPHLCNINSSGVTHEENLRRTFAQWGRPTFGLEDIGQRCAAIQGNTIEQDTELARFIVRTLTDPTQMQAIVNAESSLVDILKCGDLAAFADMQFTFKSLPWLFRRVVAQNNNAIASGIQNAMDRHPDQKIMAAVSVAQLMDIGDAPSTLKLLAERGFRVDRIHDKTDLGCSFSTSIGPGAADLGECLAPPFQTQPDSCINFATKFDAKVGKDPLYGRKRDDLSCVACSLPDGPCSCEVRWTNTSAFEDLCAEPIDSISGVVFNLDLTKNPDSSHVRGPLSEHTIYSFTQDCYATTCDRKLIEEMVLRRWYGEFGDLAEGKAISRPASQPAPRPNLQRPLNGGSPQAPSPAEGLSTERVQGFYGSIALFFASVAVFLFVVWIVISSRRSRISRGIATSTSVRALRTVSSGRSRDSEFDTEDESPYTMVGN